MKTLTNVIEEIKRDDINKVNYSLEPMGNMYGIVNAFTRTARDMENEQRLEVEKLAGSLLPSSVGQIAI